MNTEVIWRSENGIPDLKELLALLDGQVFHATTRLAYQAILKDGAVLHNKGKRFPLNTHSENSYGRCTSCVCLFDLRPHNKPRIQDILDCYYFLKPSWFAKETDVGSVWEMVYLLLHPRHYGSLVANVEWTEYVNSKQPYLDAIPYGEVWIQERMPLEWVERIISATIVEPPPTEGSLEWLVKRSYDIEESKHDSG